MKVIYRVLRVLGVIGAAWIISGLISAYFHLQGLMADISFSPETQKVSLWMSFFIGAIPYGVIALMMLLPYGRLPRMIQLTCVALFCIAIGFVGWNFLRPCITISGFHFEAIPMVAWLMLIGNIALIVSQIVAILWIQNKSNKAVQPTATRV